MAVGGLSPSGRELRTAIEEQTDRLATPPFAALDGPQSVVLGAGLREVAGAVGTAGDIPFPNPIGLDAVGV
jgi:hypothetical protein